MERLSYIKWHAQEIIKLIKKDPPITSFAPLCTYLESTVIADTRFKNIEAVSPDKETPKKKKKIRTQHEREMDENDESFEDWPPDE